MVSIDVMPTILTLILLGVGLTALVGMSNHLAARSYFARQNLLLIDIVVVFMYLLLCGFTGVLYLFSGYDISVIYGVLGLVVLAILIMFFVVCIKHKRSMQSIPTILFLVYFGVVLYLTVFMRIGSVDTSVVTTPFDDLRDAILKRDPQMASHMFLNVLLFLPFGYLIPSMNPKHLRGWYFAMMGGLMTSTVIEGVQLLFHLGQSDIDDIIANTFGAILGYGAVRFLWRVRRNWRL